MSEPKKWSEFTPKEKKRAKINLTMMFIIVICLIFLGVMECNDNTPEPAKEAVYNSEWDGSVKQVEDYLENTLNDPDSYSSVEWGTVVKNPDTKWYIVRHKYRAKNVFGGTIIKHQVFTLDSLGIVLSVSDIE